MDVKNGIIRGILNVLGKIRTPELETTALTGDCIKTRTSVGTLDWTSAMGSKIPTLGCIAYWNGAYSGTSSNLAYCNKGAFGDAATKTMDSALSSTSTNPIQNKVIYNLYNPIGTRSAGSTLATTSTTSWTNNASVTLSAGTYAIEGQFSVVKSGGIITARLLAGSTDIGRQSVYCLDGNTYSAHLTTFYTLTASTTIYLQSWSPNITSINGLFLYATRIK